MRAPDSKDLEPDTLVEKKLPTPAARPFKQRDSAVLAIVVDDCGSNFKMAKLLVDLKLPLTFAIIPHLKYSLPTAEMFVSNDVPFLIHLPMQAYVDPDGKAGGKLYSIGVGMTEDAISNALLSQIDSLPGAFGVNNHRGSKATSDARTMRAVMKVLKERDVFFLDSSTSSRTVGYKIALEMGLMSAKNNFFLDGESDKEKIEYQTMRAVKAAAKKGEAIAICHLRAETIEFLKTLSPERIKKEYGVELITLPNLVEFKETASSLKGGETN